MSFHTKPRTWVVTGVAVAAAFVLYQIWVWEVERVEVGPEKFVVLVHRWGTNLPEDDIVAPDDSYKGILLEVLPEGRHFLNPIVWGHEVHDAVKVPPGKCLVLTRKYGVPIAKERLERGDILAHDGERGILREVKLPGIHRINPYAYEYSLVEAVEVKDSQVGVRTLKIGDDPRELRDEPGSKGRYIVSDGFRGVQKTTVPAGTYYINPFVEEIKPVETRSHKVELADIQFPSRDGFILKPHVQVEYQVRADLAPEVFVRLSDEGTLNQEDSTREQQDKNQILQKVLLPMIRGYARIEGSNFDARDFILTDQEPGMPKATNSREALQKGLLTRVTPHCEELGIRLLAVKLETLEPPAELRQQISERDLAKVEQNKFRARIGQLKAEQKLKAVEGLKQQNKEKVEAQTRLVQAKTKANQLKEVEESRLKQELENAELKLAAARKEAEAKLAKGKAEAAVVMAQNEAQIAGLRTAVLGFAGPNQYAQYQILSKLAPALSEIFASDDSDFAKLFAGYMTPATNKSPASVPAKPVAAPTMPPASGGTGTPGN